MQEHVAEMLQKTIYTVIEGKRDVLEQEQANASAVPRT